MYKYKVFSKMRYLVLLLVAFAAGCASNAQEVPVIVDNVRPTVSFTAPEAGEVAVPINRKVSVAFSEVMNQSTITSATFTLTGPGLTPVSGAVAYVGTSATFTPAVDLVNNTSYTATITTGSKDLAGNALAANYGWTFTTGAAAAADTTAPTVSVTSPTHTAIAVPIGRLVTIGFSEAMDPATVTPATFKLAGPGTTAVTGTVTPVGTSAVFDSTNNLLNNTLYTATVTTGVKDLAGNAMALDFVFTFTTGIIADTTAPIVISTIPLNLATGVANNSDITATFSESMNPLTTTTATYSIKETVTGNNVPGAVNYTVGSRSATFNPTALLTSGLNYTATIKSGALGVKDLAGNALVLDKVWSFTVGAAADTIAPTVILVNPLNLATNVAINSAVNATFNEAMSLDTMTTANVTVNETGVIGNVPGTVAYDVQNNIATFTPQSNLKPDTGYTVTVTNGATDLAGNALVVPAVNGLPVPNPWTFRTAATIVPPPALAINLRSAESFGIAARAGLTSTGVTVVNGDIALHPLAGCTDSTGNLGASQDCLVKIYSSPTGMAVNGSIYWAGDPFDNGGTALSVTNDLNIAWTEGMNKVDTLAGILLGELGAPGPDGKIILPGVYNEANLGFAAGMVATFDGLNDANAIFIIKVGTIGGAGDFVDSGTLLLPTQIKLVNGAQAKNIWFVVGRDITIGSGTTWNGNILAGRDAVVNNGSTVVGRVLAGAAGAGAITLTGAASPSVTTISVPQ